MVFDGDPRLIIKNYNALCAPTCGFKKAFCEQDLIYPAQKPACTITPSLQMSELRQKIKN